MSLYLRMPIAVEAWQWLPGKTPVGPVVPYDEDVDDPCGSCGQAMGAHGSPKDNPSCIACPGDWVVYERGRYETRRAKAFADDYRPITNRPFAE